MIEAGVRPCSTFCAMMTLEWIATAMFPSMASIVFAKDPSSP